MFDLVTFRDLKTMYGNEVALSLLQELERHVKLNSARLADYDPEKRMQLVFDILDCVEDKRAFAAVGYA